MSPYDYEELSAEAKRPIECTYDKCIMRFTNQKEMKLHKKNDPDHFYCKKCDVDCEDWEDLVQHKVELMSPFLDNRTKLVESGEQPKHITCEFCGMDFKSFGGRKAHREQSHQADQSIECPAKAEGCNLIFTRAANMVQHLEKGRCRYISRHEFIASIQHKHVMTELWKNPDAFESNLNINKTLTEKPHPCVLAEMGEEDGEEPESDDEDGGVALLDQDDLAQKWGRQPLPADVDLIDMKQRAAPNRDSEEEWPALPSQSDSDIVEGMRSMAASMSGFHRITPRDSSDGAYAHTLPQSEPDFRSLMASAKYPHDSASQAIAERSISAQSLNQAWNPGNTLTALFKDVKDIPDNWYDMMKEHERRVLAEADAKENILYTRFYDPHSADYKPELFLSSVTDKYCCPFPDCLESFDEPSDISAHLQYAHLKTHFVCSTCLKRFHAAAPLVAHMETSIKCKVKYSNNYKKLLDEVTGGFLKAKLLDVPNVYKAENAMVLGTGKPVNGVMKVEFKAKLPEQK